MKYPISYEMSFIIDVTSPSLLQVKRVALSITANKRPSDGDVRNCGSGACTGSSWIAFGIIIVVFFLEIY